VASGQVLRRSEVISHWTRRSPLIDALSETSVLGGQLILLLSELRPYLI
jgi:hypothetical protein